MTFFKRSFQITKETLGVSKKTVDDELKELKTELASMQKRLKKSHGDFLKLPDSGRTATVAHMTALKSGMEVMAESSCFEDMYSVFEELDQKATIYGVKVRDEVIAPIKKLVDLLNVVEKRMKIVEQRRVDMDAASSKIQSISKKPIEKQHGLAEAETRYADAKDAYDYLRNEVAADARKCLDEVKKRYPQICVNCMKSYTDYVNELNDIWARVPSTISSVEEYNLDSEFPLTPNESSCVVLENVRLRKNEDVGSFALGGGSVAATTAAPMTTSSHPPPQLPKKKEVNVNTVTALYDYDATEEGELTFKEGDIITVFDRSGDWWTGEVNGQKGVFPSNYVQ